MRQAVLHLLRQAASGEVNEISGEDISRQLGISRAAVAKHVKGLREAGYKIEAWPHRGYRFVCAPDVLDQTEISACLVRDIPWRVESHTLLDSTNIRLRALAEADEPEYRVVIAEQQSKGLGRLDRVWYSPDSGGLWMSLLFRPPLPPARAQLMTLTAAVSVAQALSALGISTGIKWPNDVLSPDGRKLCGIRSEMRADIDRVDWLLTGIGLNINNRDFPPELKKIAVSLAELNRGQKMRRAVVAARILDIMGENYRLLCSGGFNAIREQWMRYAVGLGQEVTINNSQGAERGIALGLDDEGYMLLGQGGKAKRVLAGDMILTV